MPSRPVAAYAIASLAVATGLTACSTAGSPARAARAPSVVIISIDGLRPEFYLEPSYDAPYLHQLAAQGAAAESAEAVYPTLTYPNHTSMVTGVGSAKHGVHSNTVFTWEQGSTPLWYWEESYIRVPTLWQRAKAAGKTVAIMTWPGSVGAKVDWLVPELFPPSPLSKESTWDLTRKNMDPRLLDELAAHNDEKVLDGFDQRDRWVTQASAYLERAYRPDLTLIHLINLDHAEHDHGRESASVREALKIIDAQLGRIVDSLDLTRTTLIVLGDHGFFDYDRLVNPNVLFARKGWIRTQGKDIAEWKALVHPGGGQAAVYSKDRKLDRKILALLRKNAGQAYRILDRRELDRLEAFPGALCALDPLPGYSLGKSATGELIEKLPSVHGQHGSLPTNPGMQSGLIATGRGVTPGRKLGKVKLIDVAPTAARILGFEMPGTEGHAIEF